MDKHEATHARSMARHIRQHAASIVAVMQAWEGFSDKDLQNVPVRNAIIIFTNDLQHTLKEINQVVKDMLPELETK